MAFLRAVGGRVSASNQPLTVCLRMYTLMTSTGIGPDNRRSIGRVRYRPILAGIADTRCRYRPRSISKLTQVCLFHHRQIWAVRLSLPPKVLLTLVYAFVSPRWDFRSGITYGRCSLLFDRLQSILNAAARLVSAAIRNRLHWLPVRESRLQTSASSQKLFDGCSTEPPHRPLHPTSVSSGPS